MYTGLRYPYISKLNESTGLYESGFVANKGVELVFTPAFNTTSYPGDDKIVKQIDIFKNATVAAKVTSLPIVAASVVFGHTVSGNNIVRNVDDKPNYVGYGYVTTQVNDSGPDTYIAKVIPKVKFVDGAETFTANGDTITVTAPQINGAAVANDNGDWLIEETFDTIEEAENYVKVYLNITDQVAAPVASVDAGTYTEAQSVTLSCATSGATIYYTTNGLTPTAADTEYTTAIAVPTSQMLKAIAIKSESLDSRIMENEYIITA